MIPTLYEKFQSWSATGSVYVFSDTHFDDIDCKYMDPGWISPREQIEILKKKVHRGDTLLHLGDVGDPEYLRELRCYKVLIMGNHDQSKEKFQPYFDEVYEGPLFISKKILLSHEPIEGMNWCFNIHGHDHSDKYCKDMYHLNVAANVCGYTPVNLKDVIKGGALANVKSIHRVAIDGAVRRKGERNEV